MTEQIITCPKCSQKLKIQRSSDVAIQFDCSSCGQTLKLGARNAASTPVPPAPPRPSSSAPIAAKPVSPPAATVSAAPVQPPPSPAPTPDLFEGLAASTPQPTDPLNSGAPAASNSSAWQAAPPRRQLNLKPLRAVLIAGVILGLVSGAGLLVYKFLPAGTFAKLNPLSDSPESVLASMRSLLNSATNQLGSIHDAASRERAIQKLKALEVDAQDLQRRAAMIRPVPAEEHQALEERFRLEFEPIREKLKNTIARIRDEKLASAELTKASLIFSFAVSDVASAMSVGWRELPEPASDEEQLEYEKAVILRDIWRATMATITTADYEALASRLEDIPDRYRALAPLETKIAEAKATETGRAPGFPPNFGHQDTYRDFTFEYEFQTVGRMEKLNQEFGTHADLQRITQEISQAKAELRSIEHEIEAKSYEQRFAERRASGGPRGPGPPRRDFDYSAGPGARATGLEEYDLGTPAVPSPTIERILQNFVRVSGGPQNLVIIRFSNLRQDARLGSLAQEMVRSLVRIPPLISRDGTQAAMAVKYKDSVSDVANLIEFGTVTQIDDSRRVIFVDAAN